ncbi:hypothetical protein IKQ26_08450 [bacterium]|nr:hypothetical protein [bacterium]
MQITKITTTQPKQNNSISYKQSTPSFKGFDSMVVNVMEAIERGGLVASFTTQDMLGTNLPRPITALSRNKKENKGQKNKTFALKEALREFTTGPSMFIIPGIILSVAKKSIGKAMDIPAQFIKGMGEIYKSAPLTAQGAAVAKTEFYKNVFENILKNSTTTLPEKELHAKAAEFAENLAQIDKAKPKNFLKNFRGIFEAGSQQDLITELSDKFFHTIKTNNDNALADFTVGTLDVGVDGVKKSAPFKKLIGYMRNYADDVVEKTTETINIQSAKPTLEKVTEFINNANIKRITGRYTLNLLMAGAVLCFLPMIPKIYNVSKDNPALRGLEKPVEHEKAEITKKGAN